MIAVSVEQARKVYDLVSCGLVKGVGEPKPGRMCVESAIAHALDLPFNDSPTCVDPVHRRFAIRLNDSSWSSDKARAKGLRDLAIAQLGSVDLSREKTAEWIKIIAEQTIRQIVPIALRAAASRNPKHEDKLEAAAVRCEKEGTRESAYAAYAADAAAYAAAADAAEAAAASAADAAAADAADAYAAEAAAAARDKVLSLAAKIAVDAYRKIDAPGIKLLDAVRQ